MLVIFGGDRRVVQRQNEQSVPEVILDTATRMTTVYAVLTVVTVALLANHYRDNLNSMGIAPDAMSAASQVVDAHIQPAGTRVWLDLPDSHTAQMHEDDGNVVPVEHD